MRALGFSPKETQKLLSAFGGVGVFIVAALVLMASYRYVGLSLLLVLMYIVVSVSIDITIAGQKQEDGQTYDFDPVCTVILTEALKLSLSVCAFLVTRLR